ncbi:MAG TPA: nucleotidyltransferase family protein [Puia sp.]|nr:nucleotidyltransferase family protein [Puia sp.]
MPLKEALILAGGLGTRLRPIVPDIPKCMAPVSGRPFLQYLISYFQFAGIKRFVFSLGYQHELIEQFLHSSLAAHSFTSVIEVEPLGTGGAILLAATKMKDESVLVANGDTLFKIDISELSMFHKHNDADCTVCLKPMQSFDRYGAVILRKDFTIEKFEEKKYYDNGLISGGVYALQIPRFFHYSLPQKFSFEKDFLEANSGRRKFMGFVQDKYFIDIGVPADYFRAQAELKEEI